MTTTTGKGTALADHESHRGASDISGTCTASRHGDRKAYDQAHCRCPAALADRARYERLRGYDAALGRPRRVDATGTRRRIQALATIGWPLEFIASKIGVGGRDAVWLLTKRRWVNRPTAARVAAAYDELADRRGPSSTTALRAERRGWLGPMWWDDDTIDDPDHDPLLVENVPYVRPEEELFHTFNTLSAGLPCHELHDVDPVAVERALAGEWILLTRDEKRTVFGMLRDRGVTVSKASVQLHLSGSTARAFEAARTGISVMHSSHTAATNHELEEATA